MHPVCLAMLVLLAVVLFPAGCGPPGTGARADGVRDTATSAAVAAAEARARAAEAHRQAAEGGKSKAEADAADADAREAEARALALHNAAETEDERQAKARAEKRAEIAAEDRDRLGWWATAAGTALLVLSAGASVLGWYFGLGKLTQGLGAAGAASGAVALAMGLSWGWLPILAAVLIVGGALVLLLRRAGAAIGAHAERMHTVPVDDPGHAAKAVSAAEQVRDGVWVAVQRLRGKAADRGKLQRLLAGTVR